jgi:hypothetical protein
MVNIRLVSDLPNYARRNAINSDISPELASKMGYTGEPGALAVANAVPGDDGNNEGRPRRIGSAISGPAAPSW